MKKHETRNKKQEEEEEEKESIRQDIVSSWVVFLVGPFHLLPSICCLSSTNSCDTLTHTLTHTHTHTHTLYLGLINTLSPQPTGNQSLANSTIL